MSLLQQVPIERSLNSQSEEGLTKKESNCSFLSETGLRYYEDHVFESEKPQKKKKKKKRWTSVHGPKEDYNYFFRTTAGLDRPPPI